MKKFAFLLILIFVFSTIFSVTVFAEPEEVTPNTPVEVNENLLPGVNITIGDEDKPASTVQLLLLITILTLAPSILILFTCFTRIIIVLHFVRAALSTQQVPPNQVIVGLALFLTLMIMSPTISKINQNAYQPYANGEITQSEFLTESMKPIREFMFAQVEEKDLVLFSNLAGIESYSYQDEIPNTVLIPAYIVGEITKGFKIGFVLYIPFIVIDMVVASTLMAMGMMMLPPALISAPFKLLLFIMVDGWQLIIGNLVKTFY